MQQCSQRSAESRIPERSAGNLRMQIAVEVIYATMFSTFGFQPNHAQSAGNLRKQIAVEVIITQKGIKW